MPLARMILTVAASVVACAVLLLLVAGRPRAPADFTLSGRVHTIVRHRPFVWQATGGAADPAPLRASHTGGARRPRTALQSWACAASRSAAPLLPGGMAGALTRSACTQQPGKRRHYSHHREHHEGHRHHHFHTHGRFTAEPTAADMRRHNAVVQQREAQAAAASEATFVHAHSGARALRAFELRRGVAAEHARLRGSAGGWRSGALADVAWAGAGSEWRDLALDHQKAAAALAAAHGDDTRSHAEDAPHVGSVHPGAGWPEVQQRQVQQLLAEADAAQTAGWAAHGRNALPRLVAHMQKLREHSGSGAAADGGTSSGTTETSGNFSQQEAALSEAMLARWPHSKPYTAHSARQRQRAAIVLIAWRCTPLRSTYARPVARRVGGRTQIGSTADASLPKLAAMLRIDALMLLCSVGVLLTALCVLALAVQLLGGSTKAVGQQEHACSPIISTHDHECKDTVSTAEEDGCAEADEDRQLTAKLLP